MKKINPHLLFVCLFSIYLSASLIAGDVTFKAGEKMSVVGMKELEGVEIIDFDGDGVQDLLSGLYSGHLLFRRNTGTDAKPSYAEPEQLKLENGELIKLKHW